MRKITKRVLCVLLCMSVLLAGCGTKERQGGKVSSEATELPALETFEENTEEIELPRSYSYIEEKRAPLLRNQEGTNTCWAFAALSALECSKDGDAKSAYSADHLIFHNPFGKRFQEGGSYIVTMAYLLAWKGPVSEMEDPFDQFSPVGSRPCIHVQEVRLSEPKDYEAIKRFVYLYGGVESALYLDFDEFMTKSSYYNAEHYSYCYPGTEVSNHDVVIIGWDDDYPAENFVGNVSTDGAFICQNSWGNNFGDHGVFYVSYEDVNIGGYGVAYSRIDPVDNYDRIHQSDLCGYTAQIGYQREECWFSNVYTAKEDQLLRAAGFYATGKHTEYEIYVVPEFSGESSFAQRQFACSGYLEDAGYYTIDFPEEVEIGEGNDFAVVVRIKTENAEYPVAIECQVEGLSESADISDGRSYLSYQGISWEHLEESRDYNICLKAYADIQ